MREFLKSFFSFGVATSIEKILAFILLPIYTRLFTTTEYGMIDLCQVLMGIVSVFALHWKHRFNDTITNGRGMIKKSFCSAY